VIVCFVDNGGIDDHFCVNFPFCVQWAKMRGDCLFCWYWWNWLPLLFKLSFLFSELRWKVIVCYVDIGGIDDHYCLNFLFCSVSWDERWLFALLILMEFMTITVKTFFFVFSELRWEVIVCFTDIGGIDHHYCLNFLVCVQWVEMRGDCLFCWYWWNWWPLLCKLSFLFSELR
jgi:hypothetical protein